MMRDPILRLHLDELVVDNFAGGGGASEGIRLATGRDPDIAVNHDAEALAMHAANHPGTRHYCENVWDIDPEQVCAGRPVGLAWFSPDCTFHSKARGGKPHRDRRRALRRRGLAWVVTRWARAVRPRVICLENVEEFQDWGPLDNDGRPDPGRAGFTFRRWVAQLRGCGYDVEWRELRACDFGAPTSRKRLFVVARCDGAPIVWPVPTHGKGRPHPWRTAAECIDWTIPCPSIFERSRPLAEKTLRRIARGIQRYVVEAAHPFVVPLRGTSSAHTSVHPVDEPLSTVSAGGTHHALVTPFTAPLTHAGDARAHSLAAPLPTVTGAHRGEQALVAPTLVQTGYGERPGQAPRALDLQQPLGTIVASQKHGLVAAFLARHFGQSNSPVGKDVRDPFPTIMTRDHNAVVSAHLGLPLGGRDHRDEVRSLLAEFCGRGDGSRLQLPLGAAAPRPGVVVLGGQPYAIVDIGMRMLQPRELFNAQGFRGDYVIDPDVDGERLTKTAQVRMVGNSVCPPLAAAIVRANLAAAPARVEETAA